MPGEKNPWEIPEWHAIGREAALVRHLVGSAATALGQANYADKTGEYYTAFFGLSVGLERLTKLILVVDHAIENNGQMPEEAIVRRFGHRLAKLIDAADIISRKHALSPRYARPSSEICASIINCIDSFSDAGRGRYANFAALGDPNLGQDEPIKKWWGEVAELILQEHYYGKRIQQRIEARARVVDTLMSPFAMVRHIDETENFMGDIPSSSIRTGQTKIVQLYGRFYSLSIVRWLSEIFSLLANIACYTYKIDAFFGVWEYFETYTVDDNFLKTRKNWPLT